MNVVKNSFEVFLDNLDKYCEEDKLQDVTPWIIKDEYTVKLLSYEMKKSKNDFDMLDIKFRDCETYRIFHHYIVYGHSDTKVRNINARKLKDLLNASRDKTTGENRALSQMLNGEFVVKIKVDDVLNPKNFNITKVISFQAENEELQF